MTCFTHHKKRLWSWISLSQKPVHWPWVTISPVESQYIFSVTRGKASIFSLSSFGHKLEDMLSYPQMKGGGALKKRRRVIEGDQNVKSRHKRHNKTPRKKKRKLSVLLLQSILISFVAKSINFTCACAISCKSTPSFMISNPKGQV